MGASERVLGVVPARGGSRGIPRKNIALLAGRPLIAHTLAVGRAAAGLDDLVVSTDSEEIAAVARDYGGRVPFLRPAELAGPETPAAPVVTHVLDRLEADEGQRFDTVMLLQPTAPLRSVEDVERALALLRDDPDADAVISVRRVEEPHPYKLSRVVGGYLEPFLPDRPIYQGPRQALPPVYAFNGALYVTRVAALREHASLLGRRARAYEMPPERSVNIDGPLDLLLAEALIARRVGEG